MTIDELLSKLDPQINYLGNTISVPGMDKNDVKQEMRLYIIVDFNKIKEEDREKYKEGWWFKRLQWFLKNLIEKEKNEPTNRALRFERFDKGHDTK